MLANANPQSSVNIDLNNTIDTQALTLNNSNNETLDIRPKTCQLLVYLLEHSDAPTSKQTLLETVWAGSVVSEQVVFQSVNEIRRLFPNDEVIKTIPQQGYLWLPQVNKRQKTVVNKLTMTKGIFAFFILSMILLSAIMITDALNDGGHSGNISHQVTGSIVILPTENQISGNDHTWVRLGLMDHVIQRLPNSEHHLVLQADYVLEVLKRSESQSKVLQAQDIQQLFMVSGAELVVSSKLIGAPHDYQLIYAFHYRNSVKKGGLLHKQLQVLIDEFTLLVAAQLNQSMPTVNKATYQTDFNNELLGTAIESSLDGNYKRAKFLLQSIVADEPENVTARRLLISALFRLKQFDQANSLIDTALTLATAKNDKDELARLLHSRALYYYVTMQDQKAKEVASQALSVAIENNDWLLMAHITNIEANVAINEEDYELAERLYNKEKAYHKVLHCPVGEANSWGYLARLAALRAQEGKFNQAINKAIDIAQTRGLERQLRFFTKTKVKGIN